MICSFRFWKGGLFLEDLTPKKKQPDKREYTVMIVPNRGDSIYSWNVPIQKIKVVGKIVAGCVAAFVLFMGFQSYLAFKVARDAAELQELRANRQVQDEKMSSLAKVANDIQNQIQEIDKLEADVKKTLAQPIGGQASRSGIDRDNIREIGNGQGGPVSGLHPDVLATQVANLKVELDRKKANLITLKGQLEERNRRIAATPTEWPTAGGSISSRFGGRNSPWGIGSTDHRGIDIANYHGADIYAAADGVVRFSGWNGGYGRSMEIEHGYGIKTVYAHTSELLANTGQYVKKGQLIARVGNTGNSTGPHLHFEVNINGVDVDPMRFLQY